MSAGEDKLLPGEALKAGQYLLSHSGSYIFMVPPQGVPTIFDVLGRKPVYNQDNRGTDQLFSRAFADAHADWQIAALVMQNDGNVVAYDKNNRPLWSLDTHSAGQDYGYHVAQGPGNYLRIQDDANLVVYNKDGRAVWDKFATGGHGGFYNAVFESISDIPSSVVALTQSPAWKVIAGVAIFIPGIGVAVSAGMAAAAVAGKVLSGKGSVIDAAGQAINLAGQSGLIDSDAAKAGFEAAVGVLIQNPTAQSIEQAFNQLKGDPTAQFGFDAAVTLFQGTAAGAAPSAVQNADAKAGFYMAQGAAVTPANSPASTSAKAAANLVAQKSPQAQAGAQVAHLTLGITTTTLAKPSFLEWLKSRFSAELRFLHLLR